MANIEPKRASRPEKTADAAPGPRTGCFAAIAGLVVLVGGAFAYRAWSPPEELPAPSASASDGAAAPPTPKRCVEVAPSTSYVVGPAPAARHEDDDALDRDDLLSPFAVILGRAAAIDGGYALGVLGDGEGGSLATVVTVDADAKTGKTVRLSRSRGDLDPPVVSAIPGAPGDVLVAFLEPDASGRSVRVARVHDGNVTLGADIHEGRDESLAIDVAASQKRGLVAWDGEEHDDTFVAVAGFPLDAVGKPSDSGRITKNGVDAGSPRLVPRDGGFYVVYQVLGKASRREAASDRDEPASSAAPFASSGPAPAATPKTASKKPKSDDSDEVDESRGEPVQKIWLEAMLLDESGAPSGEPLGITPTDGHVVSFDVAPGPEGSLVVAWRDDDSPTGAGGGPVRVVKVSPSGVGTPYVGPDDAPADGAPTLLPGWLGMPTLQGPDLLARLGNDGLPAEKLEVETSLGRGEPIAAIADRLLLAEPEGKAMRLRVVACGDRPAPLPEPSAEPKEDE
ncbi:MAG TPA: hypothetical protein VL400_02700 [Polyangiaceae bacterium]|nr:hypothetical protein [Polyangiaceae bacterium]